MNDTEIKRKFSRDIKFRAKMICDYRAESNPWIYFSMSDLNLKETLDIIEDETLCQSTGLKDINGVEIYEGDLFKSFGNTATVKFGSYVSNVSHNGSCNSNGFYLDDGNFISSLNDNTEEIIGNEYDSTRCPKCRWCYKERSGERFCACNDSENYEDTISKYLSCKRFEKKVD